MDMKMICGEKGLIYCAHQTFVERENFFEKGTGKFFAKTLPKVSYNIHNVYKLLINIIQGGAT